MPVARCSLWFSIPGSVPGPADPEPVYEFLPSTLSAARVDGSRPPVPARELLATATAVLVHGYHGHWPLNAYLGPALDPDDLVACLFWIATGRPLAAGAGPGQEESAARPSRARASDPSTA